MGGVVGVNEQSVYMNESVRNTSVVCCYKRNPQICHGLLSEVWMYVSKDGMVGQVSGHRCWDPLH